MRLLALRRLVFFFGMQLHKMRGWLASSNPSRGACLRASAGPPDTDFRPYEKLSHPPIHFLCGFARTDYTYSIIIIIYKMLYVLLSVYLYKLVFQCVYLPHYLADRASRVCTPAMAFRPDRYQSRTIVGYLYSQHLA